MSEAMPIDRKRLELPPHPRGWKCSDCPAWLKKHAYTAVVLPDGTAVPESLARDQIPMTMLAHCKRTTESFCTAAPAWIRKSADGWCWQFQRMHELANG